MQLIARYIAILEHLCILSFLSSSVLFFFFVLPLSCVSFALHSQISQTSIRRPSIPRVFFVTLDAPLHIEFIPLSVPLLVGGWNYLAGPETISLRRRARRSSLALCRRETPCCKTARPSSPSR